MPTTHSYHVRVTWTGNQGTGTSGYRAYSRDHEVTMIVTAGTRSGPGQARTGPAGDNSSAPPGQQPCPQGPAASPAGGTEPAASTEPAWSTGSTRSTEPAGGTGSTGNSGPIGNTGHTGHNGPTGNGETAGPTPIAGSSDPAFRGDPGRWNPEQLLTASLAQCHLLWYLHLCAAAGVVVTAYTDDASGTMVEDADGGGRFTEVILRPRVLVAAPGMAGQAAALHRAAHEKCFIAASVAFPVRHEPTIMVAGSP